MLCKATLQEGDFLLWNSEWREVSKKSTGQNAQSGNPEWNLDLLLGEGLCEGSARQIEYPTGMYAQIAMAARKAWIQLPTKGKGSGSLAGIRQGPEEPFQNFVARSQQAVSRTLGASHTDGPLITQLAYENANTACKADILLHKGQMDLSEYSPLCRYWTFL